MSASSVAVNTLVIEPISNTDCGPAGRSPRWNRSMRSPPLQTPTTRARCGRRTRARTRAAASAATTDSRSSGPAAPRDDRRRHHAAWPARRCAPIGIRQPGLAAASASGSTAAHVAGLALAEVGRGLRLDEVVDTGAAAADRGLGDLDEPTPGSRAGRLAARADAGRGPGGRRRGRRGSGSGSARRGLEVGQELVASRTFAAKARRARPTPGRRPAVAVVLHRRAATGGVDHDGLVPLEGGDVSWPARPPSRRRSAAPARRSSAAPAERAPPSPRRPARRPWPR